ncbi:MAG: hypothetical protein II690_03655 [Ruminococcus sp.]|nr:hypothetical protein [Ruminococcus sp.]
MIHSEEIIAAGKLIVSMSYDLEKEDAGQFSVIKMSPVMKFHTEKFTAKGLGSVFVMKMNMGLMQMVSFILTPFERDMPMLSMDYIFAPGTIKAYAEFYDLTENPESGEYQAILTSLSGLCERYRYMKDVPQIGTPWYADIRKLYLVKEGSDYSAMNALFQDIVTTYIETSRTLPLLASDARERKRMVVRNYCENLVRNGGASTNVFKKKFGSDFTSQFFAKVMFGYERT